MYCISEHAPVTFKSIVKKAEEGDGETVGWGEDLCCCLYWYCYWCVSVCVCVSVRARMCECVRTRSLVTHLSNFL